MIQFRKGLTMPPIDGNAIVADNRRRKQSIPQGYGEFTNPNTGEIITSAFSKPEPTLPPSLLQQQPSKQQMQADAYDDIERDNIYAQEMAEGGGSGIVGTNKYGSPVDKDGNTPMEYMSPEELKGAQKDYLNQAGRFSNFAENNNMDMNELYSRFSEEYTQKDIDMFKDARKIKNFDDAMKVGMMGDEMADFMDLDTDKFFGKEGTMELCGEECQEKRKNNSQRQIMSMDDDEFERDFQI